MHKVGVDGRPPLLSPLKRMTMKAHCIVETLEV
jgi:hypothetical protein